MSAVMESPRALLDLRQAQERLGVSKSTMNRMVKRQEVPVVQVGRLIRIRPEALEKFITDSERPMEGGHDGDQG